MATATEQRLSEAQVRAAVDALFTHLAKEQTAKNSLLEEEDIFSLVVSLKKIPGHGSPKPHRITLPHPLWQVEGSEVCLFVKDHAGEGHKAAKERLAQADACGVTKVIGVSKLKANYKPFEAKRRLCASFDLFLSDDRILPLLPPLLGKQFFKKKKQPIPVSLAGPRGDWAAEVKRATASTSLVLGGGACSAVRCARSTQAAGQVAANVMAAAAGVVHYVPRGWANVRSMYLKTSASVALPLYTCLPTQAEAEQPGQAEKKKAKKEAKALAKKEAAASAGGAGAVAAAAAPPPALKPAGVPPAGVKRKAADAGKAAVAVAPAAPSGRAATLGAKVAAAEASAPAGKRAKR